MWFSRNEIAAASKLRDVGIQWCPQPGLYIWDQKRQIRPSSPFQRGVYFLLDLQCFVDYFGGMEQLKQQVVWLPTWEQCRACLLLCGETPEEIVALMRSGNSLERLKLYRLLERRLRAP